MKKMWSVQTESNSWNDDLFNGTYNQCVKYCKEHDYKIDGSECRLAEIVIDKRGCVVDTLRIVDEIF